MLSYLVASSSDHELSHVDCIGLIDQLLHARCVWLLEGVELGESVVPDVSIQVHLSLRMYLEGIAGDEADLVLKLAVLLGVDNPFLGGWSDLKPLHLSPVESEYNILKWS